MQALAVFGLIVLGAILVPLFIMIVVAVPDIVRYLRMRNM